MTCRYFLQIVAGFIEWHSFGENGDGSVGPYEVGRAVTYHSCLTIRIDQNCCFLVDTKAVDVFGLARSLDIREEDEQAAHAVAFGEVGVGDDAFEDGDREEVVGESDARAYGVGEGGFGVEVGVVWFVAFGGVGPFA